MGKRVAPLAIRLFVSVNLLYAAIFLKFAGAPDSVALFMQMSQAFHGLISQSVFRLGSGMFETMVAVLLLILKTARLGAGLTVVWMSAVILSHIFVLGYGWSFLDALVVMALAVIYLMLTGMHSHWGEPESVGTTAALRTHKKHSGEQREEGSRGALFRGGPCMAAIDFAKSGRRATPQKTRSTWPSRTWQSRPQNNNSTPEGTQWKRLDC